MPIEVTAADEFILKAYPDSSNSLNRSVRALPEEPKVPPSPWYLITDLPEGGIVNYDGGIASLNKGDKREFYGITCTGK